MTIKYDDLPRKIKKGLKRKLIKDIDRAFKPKQIHIKEVEVCPIANLKPYADYKGFVITHYQLY